MKFRNPLNFVLSSFAIYLFLSFVPHVYDVFAAFSLTIVGMKIVEWMMESSRKYILNKTVSPLNKAVLITGCDSGFGFAAANRMDKLGYKVFAACLNSEGKGAKDLLNNCSSRLTVLPIDVTDNDSVLRAKEFVEQNLKQNVLWAVVSNAGIAHAGEIDWTSVEELLQVYDVNAAGTLRVIKAFLPLLKKSKGRIVNTTSICGRFICPGFVGYCMSKSAAVALTTGLRIELAKWGVKAISIEPFFYSTPLTGIKALLGLAEKSWRKAPENVREEYGEEYMESFKSCIAQIIDRCNPRISEVIDCFEDAITSEEPLSTYFPSKFFDKIGIKLLLILPSYITENYQRTFHFEKGAKPAAIKQQETTSCHK